MKINKNNYTNWRKDEMFHWSIGDWINYIWWKIYGEKRAVGRIIA